MPTIKLKLTQAIAGYLAEKRITLRPRTIENYQYTFDKMQLYFTTNPTLEEITPQAITEMLAALEKKHKLSKTSLLNIHAVLSALWTWAVTEQYADTHILRQVPAPKREQRVIIPYTLDDIAKLLAACNTTATYTRPGQKTAANTRPTALRDRCIILTLLATGLRATELCQLKITDIDLDNQRVKIFGKGAKERIVRIGLRTRKTTWRYFATRPDAQATDPAFLSGRELTAPLTRYGLNRLIKRLGQRANITPQAGPHRFRHTFAISFLRNGGDVYSLKMLLGHSSLKMVQRYLALAQTDTENAHRRASPVDNWNL